MLVTPLPMVTLLSAWQPLNACSPILVTLSGIKNEVSDVQALKALLLMLVTSSGMTIFVSILQLENAPRRMFPPVIVTDLNDSGIE